MRHSDRRDARLIEAAVAEAVAAARWERIDLETRKPDCAHRELILAQAAELAMSPVGRDQLMSLALERSADKGPSDGPLIDVHCPPGVRAPIARRIFALGPHKASETDTLVRAVEARHVRHSGAEKASASLAKRLGQDAVLHEALWDHPDIPASDAVRLAMLCSVPRLRDRAQDLSATPAGWWPSLRRWLAAFSKRGL